MDVGPGEGVRFFARSSGYKSAAEQRVPVRSRLTASQIAKANIHERHLCESRQAKGQGEVTVGHSDLRINGNRFSTIRIRKDSVSIPIVSKS